MTVGIDADGILFDYIRTCAKYVNHVVGFDVASHDDTTEFDNLKCWRVRHLKDLVDSYFSSGKVVLNMPVLQGARQFINDIDSVTNGDFMIITACPASWHEQRELSLEANFGIPKHKVHFSRDKSKFKLRAMVDDYHMNLDKLDGWRILMDRPWNRNTEGVAVHRCFGYDEVVGQINRIVNWNK